MNFKTLIGLEIHVELNTKSKMFCGCKNEFGAAPNTNVCPICLGHPGALPVMNKKALEYAIMAGISFNCDIRNSFKMDRKKYFYPDLTKGYQITQQDMPLCENGYIEVHNDNQIKKIGLIRIHIEEDTGKSIHNEQGNTLMDYNRSSVPLIEIVTKPEIENENEAKEFLENLKETLKFIGVSDVKMEQGSLRCDVNLNVVSEDNKFKTKVTEVKNLNSFKAVYKAIQYEEKRHFEMAKNNEIGNKETRRWDEATNTTISMRRKEEGSDYRFSVEGDIPITIVHDKFIEEIRRNLPELPNALMKRFINDYKIQEYDADILSRNKYLSSYFETVVKKVEDAQLVSNWLLSDVLRRVKESEIEFEDIKMDSDSFAKLLLLIKNKKINNNSGKKILRELFENDFDPDEYVKEKGLVQETDLSALEKIVDEVLSNNEASINDYKNGKDRALGFLVGQCMKLSKGKGNPQVFNQMILGKIK